MHVYRVIWHELSVNPYSIFLFFLDVSVTQKKVIQLAKFIKDKQEIKFLYKEKICLKVFLCVISHLVKFCSCLKKRNEN